MSVLKNAGASYSGGEEKESPSAAGGKCENISPPLLAEDDVGIGFGIEA